jgi:Holliday junction resolvase RusA-like endonuclease
MNPLNFTVYGSPVAQPRTKAQGFIGKNGKAMAHIYEPGKADSPARQWKHDVKAAALRALTGDAEPGEGMVELIAGPLHFTIKLYLPRPNSLYRKKDPEGALWHAAGKDIDNLYKSIADALNGVIYRDDKQIAELYISKRYHEKHSRPRAEIRIEPIANDRE